MRSALHLQHLRHFHNHGSILFENLLTIKDCFLLETKLQNFIAKASKTIDTVRWRENIFRSMPEIYTVVRKRRLDFFAAELVHRPKLSLVRDLWVFPGEEILEGEEDCMLFLLLSGDRAGSGIFFTGPYPSDLYELEKGTTGLLLAFSSVGIPVI
ncbi:hypothetical protein CpB0056 [Chlamydia pneumoniae TW-183]|uniref:Uncharacterized protein n=3 Tax=Chlamydia pneumoniae TaxID=83558 RepID=Q9Z9C6_CHLPN|nr:DUF5070 domain-containing protein [Chlamydia pneumoniae]AAD18208.1 CT296 hypothetical protein [Chlamydia pneumoniae CWL029]AAF38525.1 conserved hypothetical protein [Chlamydia pneumoniae AR39]AAP97989.1 hypothetical protein CpB0056 [Chlamydia pneumoniae TW-183]ACZ33028.1 conserved hypothetical protein [Chlamydia pneumoniae LPCoLN]ETR79944.1 hypothetical protein X556_0745 [Chlamydia pneumoniae B21]